MAVGCVPPSPPLPWVELVHRIPYRTVSVQNQQIVYSDQGQGPPIILIHGFGGSMWQWEYQYGEFSAHHRVIIPDLLGSGLSEKPPTTYSPKRLITFLSHFMEVLNIPRATLVGNSMGAGLAMAMALDYPERVSGLVLVSGFPAKIQDSVGSPQYQRFIHHRPPLWLAKFGNWLAGRSATERILKEIIFKHEFITPTIIERSYQNRQRGGFLEPLYSLVEHVEQWENEYGKRISRITQPTAMIWGDHDRVFPVTVGEQIRVLIPQAEWHVVEDAGHLPQWEQPHQVNQLINSFLSRLPE